MVAAKLFEPGAGRQHVDRYELVGEIASGGMATVYLARLSGVGGFRRFVAMKRLHPHLAGEKEFVEMFLDEARLAAGIHHPNVVSILEVGASPVGYYLVMEYVEGDTLARLLARSAGNHQRLPVPIAVRIVLDALQGLHAAHELKDDQGQHLELVHRDVSPQNILVGIDGISRITDFGVARATSRLTSTRVGQLKGKLAYMAPEQASGDKLDRRADVFSAGVLIWETFASKRLFKADNEAATLSRVLNEPIPELRRVAPHVSNELSAVVARALDRDRDTRFSSAAELAHALEEAATGRDGIAASRDVAKFVKDTMGDEIEQQREAVRAWLSRSEPSHASTPNLLSSPTSISVAAVSLPGEASGSLTSDISGRGQQGRKRVPLVVAGLLLLVGAAGAGFLVARSQAQPVPAPAAAPPPVAAPLPVPPTPAPEPVAEPSAAPAPSASEAPLSIEAIPVSPKVRAPAPLRFPKKKKEELDVRNPYR
ncbi:MAG TPA: serine/threonine-protein kinase [Polyangiaceae bacterium]